MSTLKPSKVPAALDALVAHAQASAEESPTGDPRNPWSVWDGPQPSDDLPLNYIVIGWTGQPDTSSVQITVTERGASSSLEAFDVHGQVSSDSGSGTRKVSRDQVFALLDVLADRIREDRTLGGIATRAALRVGGVEPFVGRGAGTTVMFTIHIEGVR